MQRHFTCSDHNNSHTYRHKSKLFMIFVQNHQHTPIWKLIKYVRFLYHCVLAGMKELMRNQLFPGCPNVELYLTDITNSFTTCSKEDLCILSIRTWNSSEFSTLHNKVRNHATNKARVKMR